MIIKNLEDTVITEKFFTEKFANAFMTDQKTLRIGNIISFLGGFSFEKLKRQADQAMNFCIEIPDISCYAGVCFQRLFLANVANILAANYIKEPIELRNDEIYIKKVHENGGISQVDGVLSFSYITKRHDTMMIYLGIYNNAGPNSHPRAFSLYFQPEVCYKVMDKINESFYYLANGIFLSTSRI